MSNDDSQQDKNRLITLAEASDLYGFNQDYLKQLAQKGRLTANKLGRMWVTTPENMEVYIGSRKKMGAYRDDIQLD